MLESLSIEYISGDQVQVNMPLSRHTHNTHYLPFVFLFSFPCLLTKCIEDMGLTVESVIAHDCRHHPFVWVHTTLIQMDE
jgi:hypothetical protein